MRFLTFVLIILACWCDTLAQPDTAETPPPDTTADMTMVLARRAMLKSMVQPGWGQWQNNQPFKALLLVTVEAGMFYGIIYQHNRWQEFSRLARDTSDPALQFDYQRRAGFYINDRNKLLWWTLWFELLNITDAYVNAALLDFDDSPDLSLQLLPGGVAVAVSLPLPFRWRASGLRKQ
ncbi:hypothetical protein H8D51_02500 [bacterium]|nr:hypothetical protein [bacterium]